MAQPHHRAQSAIGRKGNLSVRALFAIALGLAGALPLFAQTHSAQAHSAQTNDSQTNAGEAPTLKLQTVWTIDGGPYRSKSKLDPTIAITPETVFIDAMVPKGKRDHEVVRSFDADTGKVGGVIQHPDGEPFEGLGDHIAANERFTVTGISGKAQFGRGGELLVYDTASLKLLHRIKSPRGAASQYFGGTGIALQGGRILAAVPQTNDNISSAWVFDANTGKVLVTIDEPDLPDPRLGRPKRSVFGRSLAMNARYIAVSANGRAGRGGIYSKGIVYVFDARNGTLLYRLKSPGSSKASLFGAGLAMSKDRLFITGLDEEGALGWPTGKLHAFDLASGKLQYTLSDPGAPKALEDFSAGKEGWGFGNAISVDGRYLISGIPDWSGGEKKAQGGVIVFDEQTGEQLLFYGHKDGEEWGRFGKYVASSGGLLAVMQELTGGGPGAERTVLYKLTQSDK